jgi:hypothetical protein
MGLEEGCEAAKIFRGLEVLLLEESGRYEVKEIKEINE